jgi:hypothetical protein
MEGSELPPEEPIEARTWRDAVPPFPFLWRAVALGVVSFLAGRTAVSMLRKSPWLFPAAIPMAVFSLLTAWGSAVHFAGGQQFDDQAWH